MKKVKIYGHGPYVGTTGYSNHTRDFFRGISNYFPLKFRNFTVGSSWDGMEDEPHNNEKYLTNKDKEILHTQTVFNSENNLEDKRMYSNYGPYEYTCASVPCIHTYTPCIAKYVCL